MIGALADCEDCSHESHEPGECTWEGYEFAGAEGHEFECRCGDGDMVESA